MHSDTELRIKHTENLENIETKEIGKVEENRLNLGNPLLGWWRSVLYCIYIEIIRILFIYKRTTLFPSI